MTSAKKAKRWRALSVTTRCCAKGTPAPTKAALGLMDRCSVDVRLPLVAATQKLTDELRVEMKTAGLL